MDLSEVINRKIEEIVVSAGEATDLLLRAKKIVSQLEAVGLVAEIGGSLAKGTLVVKDKQDVDIFVVFGDENSLQSLGDILAGIDFGVEPRRVHGSRDYFQLIFPHVYFELIPVIALDEGNLCYANVTDMSLSHVKYITSKTKGKEYLLNDIRLAKAFTRARGFYGAESYMRGFSGYSLEILVLYFGSFENFLKGLILISKKKGDRVIDPEGFYGSAREVMYTLNASKISGPLIVVDPTCNLRNVVAGLGEETFGRFIDCAIMFLKNPTLEYFEPYVIDDNALGRRAEKVGGELLIVNLETMKEKDDVAGTKCRKFFDFFVSELSRNGQEVEYTEFSYPGSGILAVGYVIVVAAETMLVRGPDVSKQQAVSAFTKANPVFMQRDGYLWMEKNVSVDSVLKFVNTKSVEMDTKIVGLE
ncbi:MAG: tRNA nucleotidyltransferase (CCA-adding enzyme) [Patescibacteria group bacterium]|jgi:tRNA nucleotidyltransferase (CCA-adding enzyme)